MPHSSGGGFRGGGFHGGSGYHGSGGSYTSTSVTPGPGTIKSYYFTGARKFYRWNGTRIETLYSNADITSASYRKKRLIKALALLFSPVLVIAAIILVSFLPARKINTAHLRHNHCEIIDDFDYLSSREEKELMTELTIFQEKTGIPVTVNFTSDTAWKEYMRENDAHYDFVDYCYRYYLDLFNDESHWLITYTVDDYGLWRFEGMQGDDTDSILTEKKTHAFNSKMYETLSDDDLSVGESFIISMRTLNSRLGEPEVKDEWLGFLVLLGSAGLGAFSFGVVELVIVLKYMGGTFFKKEGVPAEMDCPKCYSTFIFDPQRPYCPYCGPKRGKIRRI